MEKTGILEASDEALLRRKSWQVEELVSEDTFR